MTTDALATLGTIIDDKQGKDTIHLAVVPAIAGNKLYPGQHIRMEDDKAYADGETYGIVDPFLKGPVQEGERFWFVIYPRQITSLRHVWEHPKFPAAIEPEPVVLMSYSEAWMRRWAIRHLSYDYYGSGEISDDHAYDHALRIGDDHYLGPYESAGDAIDSEWWHHWEAITGKTGDRDGYFRCSC